MYYYIFDPRGPSEIKYFERGQGKLLNLIAENQVDGETYRVTAIRTVELLVEQALYADVKTIIVAGSDQTLNRTVNAVIRKNANDVIIGFIPLDSEGSLGKILGVPADMEQAVKILAGRLVREMDLGAIGEHCFLSQVDLGSNVIERSEPGLFGISTARNFLKLEPFIIKMSLEDSFTLTAEVMAAQIINCRDNEGCRIRLGDPTDKLLDILLLNRLTSSQVFRHRKALATGCIDNVPGSTIMHAKKIDILGPRKLPLAIEGQVYTKAPATITVAKQKIKMIVGKTRQF